jgi:hypothetical protein
MWAFNISLFIGIESFYKNDDGAYSSKERRRQRK